MTTCITSQHLLISDHIWDIMIKSAPSFDLFNVYLILYIVFRSLDKCVDWLYSLNIFGKCYLFAISPLVYALLDIRL